MEEPKKKGNERNIADLEVMYNNISEQIKTYENAISDVNIGASFTEYLISLHLSRKS